MSALQLHTQSLGTNQQPMSYRLNNVIDSVVTLQFNPFQNVLVVAGYEFDQLEAKGRAYIAEHLSHVLQKDVLWVQDGTLEDVDRFFVGPIDDFLGHNRMLMNIDGRAVLVNRPTQPIVQTQVPAQPAQPVEEAEEAEEVKTPAKQQRISRPPNAYILYRKDHHKMIKEAHPEFNNNMISKVLGTAWKAEDSKVKDHYHRLADEVKDELLRAHPDYRYAPRRPGERRRRNRRDPVQGVHHDAMNQAVQLATRRS